MNKYLEKIASNQINRDDISTGKSVVVGGVGAAVAKESGQRLLGYHTVYHGTDRATAKIIKQKGFDPKHGGSGAAKVHGSERFARNSAGKVHVTKNPIVASFFANYKSKAGGSPHIVKARVSDKMWNNMERDPDMNGSKETAATSKHKIGSQFVAGGKDSKGAAAFLKARHLKNYYSTGAGLRRAGTGAAMLAGGVGALSIAAKNLRKKYGYGND